MVLPGKYPIHPILFYSGKIAGYITWLTYLFAITGIYPLHIEALSLFAWFSYVLGTIGLVCFILSMISLGKSTRLGLPSGKTALKTGGMYSISRNPMYVGFDLLTISCMFYMLTFWVFVLGVYSILIYHFIILGEEKYLGTIFGNEYKKYKTKVRRYV